MILTIDFETYYDASYRLRRANKAGLTTEEYINDERFEVIGVAVKEDEKPTVWHTGTAEEIKSELDCYDWENNLCLAHNTKFDGAILKWKFGIEPQAYMDTMLIGQALIGSYSSVSLKKMAESFDVGVKGDEVSRTSGKHREKFTAEELERYAAYCKQDVDLTYFLYNRMCTWANFPISEMQLIDITLRMYIDPLITIDKEVYKEELTKIKREKNRIVFESGVTEKVLRSDQQFKSELGKYIKKLPDTLNKQDIEFMALRNHENESVRKLMEARLFVKSTLVEKRIETYLGIADRMGSNTLPVSLQYYGAITGRWKGAEGTNLQNLPRDGEALKRGMKPPVGSVFIEADSSQIEARILAWWSGQDDVVEQFRNKEDVYKIMAGKIYKKPVEEVTSDERHMGKQAVLGCGFNMGYPRFKESLLEKGIDISYEEAKLIVETYRATNTKIVETWNQCQALIINMVNQQKVIPIGKPGVVSPFVSGITLPNGVDIKYKNLRVGSDGYVYKGKKQGKIVEDINIYGGKMVENIVQALARTIIGHQLININKRYRVVNCVHDSIVVTVFGGNDEIEEAIGGMSWEMKQAPSWAEGLPLDCETHVGRTYEELK